MFLVEKPVQIRYWAASLTLVLEHIKLLSQQATTSMEVNMTISDELFEVILIILKNLRGGLETGGLVVHADRLGVSEQELKGILETAVADLALQGLNALIAEAPAEEAKPLLNNVVIFPTTPIEA